MSKKIGGVVALVGMCALSFFLLNCGSSSSRPSGLLYVLTQGSNGSGNNVSSFAIDLGSGNLSLINSNASTCKPAGGSCGLPLNIVLDPTGATAFVLNQGIASVPTAPTIYGYTVNSDGSLGAPTPAATLTPGDTAIAMTRDAAGNFLFVITDAPRLLVFSMKPGSTTLTQVNDVSLTRLPTALSTITISSPAEELLFVTSNKDLSQNHNDNTVSVYSVGSDGAVSEKIGSPYATTTIDPLSVLAVNTNPVGQNSGGVFVYAGAAGNASGALDAFKICTVIEGACTAQSDVDNAKLLPIGAPTSTGQNPVGTVVDPTNNFLYVVCEGSNQVFGFRINTTAGTLTSLTPASEPTGSQPVAMAMHSSGKFLYTSNINASNISGFSVSTISGSMSNPITVNSPAGPSGMTAR
jgi:6-phosphogluconolactonase (cycloisomerase 2 family)